MIKTYADLKRYLIVDKDALHRTKLRPNIFGDECWKLQWRLRHLEFYYNNRDKFRYKLMYHLYRYLMHRIAVKTGISISVNCFGPGLQIMHRGTIVINDKVKIGDRCRLHVCVNIGEDINGKAPVIGNNVYIGPGAKIYGDIVIADNVVIGANAVVNRSILTPGIKVGGVPARQLD